MLRAMIRVCVVIVARSHDAQRSRPVLIVAQLRP
jgi:hypothetical protein